MAATVQPCPVTPMKRTRPASRASIAASSAPPGRQGLLPLVGVGEGMELDQVETVGAQSLERAVDLVPGTRMVPLAGLGGEEEVVAMPRIQGPILSSASP